MFWLRVQLLIYHGIAYSLIRSFIITRILELLLNVTWTTNQKRWEGGELFQCLLFIYYEHQIFITKKKKKIQTKKTQQKERRLYSRKKISLYWGQFVISKEPTKLLRRDHLARVWAVIFAFIGTQQTIGLGRDSI